MDEWNDNTECNYIVLHLVISILTVSFMSPFFLVQNMIYKRHQLQPTIFDVEQFLDLPQFLLVCHTFWNWDLRPCTSQ